MHKVFISYHHAKDQCCKDRLIDMGSRYGLFVDRSVHPGDISNELKTETIREKIRDDYLCDSTVTILLCGEETQYRKHVDWELKSSMIDGQQNKKSGILVILLPSICSRNCIYAAHGDEKKKIYPDLIEGWISLESKPACKERFPDLPERIIDNLLNLNARISVCPWNRIEGYPDNLKWLIDAAFISRETNEYDLTLPMKMQNGSS